MFEMGCQLSAKRDLPYTMFDVDQADPRAFSEAQFETRVQGLEEAMAARDA